MQTTKYSAEQIDTMLRNEELNWKIVRHQLGASDVTTQSVKKEVMKLRKALKAARDANE